MKTASVAEVKAQFSSYMNAGESGPGVVMRNGKAVAAIVGVHDEDEIERLLMAYSPRLQAILAESRNQIRVGDVLNEEEFWAEVEKNRATGRRRRKRKTATRTYPRVRPLGQRFVGADRAEAIHQVMAWRRQQDATCNLKSLAPTR